MSKRRTGIETQAHHAIDERGNGPNNLPFEVSSFVGRQREIAEAKGLLEKTRLLTLSGPGGCGKTRLALRLAADLAGSLRGGLYWVGLSSLSEPTLVPQAVASVLNVRELASRDLLETLCHHLGTKRMLLILDNCEHLIEACAALVYHLLGTCPGLRVLTTSREPLSITGETVFSVPPLSLPDPVLRTQAEKLLQYEAVCLFVERARAARPTFALDDRSASAVARLCVELDGMPLAIELAAARVRMLSPEQILGKLDDRFGLLSSGPRMATSRHSTLRAVVDWSHDLLLEKEKILFRRTSVFAGGFSLPAAEAVCAGTGVEEHEVLDLLSHLVDKSLVVAQERDGQVRYRLLETVRQYGKEKLEALGEAEAVRRRHAEFFLRFADEAEPNLNGRDRDAWLGRAKAEHDNLRAALSWSQEQAEDETGLRLAGDLFWFWFHGGYWSEGRRWLEEALVSDGRLERTAARAKALYGAGFLAWTQGDHAAARARLEESVGIWRELGDEQGLAHALHILGMELLGNGERAKARSLAEESVCIFRKGEDAFGLAVSLASLGIATLAQGEYGVARTFLEESVAACRELGDRWALSLPLRNLGIAAFREGDLERAEPLLRESLLVLRETREQWFVTRSIEHLAMLAAMRGEHVHAARLFGAGETLREAFGASVLPIYRDDYDRGMAVSRGALGEEAFAGAWAEGRAMTPEETIAHALEEPPRPQEEEEGVHPPTTGAAYAEAKGAPEPYPEGLTTREAEVLGLLAGGKTNKEIAQELVLSVSTVQRHVANVYAKIGAHGRAEATAYALRRGIAGPRSERDRRSRSEPPG